MVFDAGKDAVGDVKEVSRPSASLTDLFDRVRHLQIRPLEHVLFRGNKNSRSAQNPSGNQTYS